MIKIIPAAESAVSDAAIETLLTAVYVAGGFTDPEVAKTLFRPTDVRARGQLLCAVDGAGGLVGTVIAVLPGSPACKLATLGEAELHLLCVHPSQQGRGVGGDLVEAAVAFAAKAGTKRMILWTQPSMHAAHRLYLRHKFVRVPARDFARGDRQFLVFVRDLP